MNVLTQAILYHADQSFSGARHMTVGSDMVLAVIYKLIYNRQKYHIICIYDVTYKNIMWFINIIYPTKCSHHTVDSSSENKTQVSRDQYQPTDRIWQYHQLSPTSIVIYDNNGSGSYFLFYDDDKMKYNFIFSIIQTWMGPVRYVSIVQVTISSPLKSPFPHLSSHHFLTSQVTISSPLKLPFPHLSSHHFLTSQVTISSPLKSPFPHLSRHHFLTSQVTISSPLKSPFPHISCHNFLTSRSHHFKSPFPHILMFDSGKVNQCHHPQYPSHREIYVIWEISCQSSD